MPLPIRQGGQAGTLLETPTLRSGGLKLSYFLRQMRLSLFNKMTGSQMGAGFYFIWVV
jgi:hypothetical protein